MRLDEAVLDAQFTRGVDGLGNGRFDRRAIIRVYACKKRIRAAVDCASVSAEHRAGATRPRDRLSDEVPVPGRDVSRFDRQTQALLTRLECLLGPLASDEFFF